MGLVGLMGIRDGKCGDRIFTRLGKMFFRTGEEKGPGNRRKKERGKTTFSPIVQSHRYERSEILLAHRRK